MYGLHVIGYVGIAILVSAISSPTIFGENLRSNFISRSSEDITEIILKNNNQNETNYIFSPFGYSVILGILSEGARGDTRDELRKVLHSPEDTKVIRENFRNTLERLQEKATPANIPEFRNYFYVYKNFTVDDDYKSILLENYFTEVKSVDRPTSYDEFSNSVNLSATEDTTKEKLPISVQQDSTKKPILHRKRRSSRNYKINAAKINHNRIKRLAKRFLGVELEDKAKSEISSFSANRLQSDARGSGVLSKMIIFNGLYFKGYWKIPFQYKNGEEPFHKTNSETIMTKMIYSVGEFNIGHIPELDSFVFALPYKGERYSFIIILPNQKNDIHKLIYGLNKISLNSLYTKLEPRHVQISIPVFEFNSISYLKEPLKSIGVQKIFSEEADFKGLSKDNGLFVDDVVQLVTIKVDNEVGTPNFLTASSLQTRTVTEKFTADRPFVFFIQDHKDDLIIAAGKLFDPKKQENVVN